MADAYIVAPRQDDFDGRIGSWYAGEVTKPEHGVRVTDECIDGAAERVRDIGEVTDIHSCRGSPILNYDVGGEGEIKIQHHDYRGMDEMLRRSHGFPSQAMSIQANAGPKGDENKHVKEIAERLKLPLEDMVEEGLRE